jgi:hypothetical protein
MTTAAMLTGAELVLVAGVPRAGDRWQQVHFNQRVAEEFFWLKIGDTKQVLLERVDDAGYAAGRVKRPLVYSEVNKNCKVEFDFPGKSYPAVGYPLLIIVELARRSFRYRSVFPGDSGYDEMEQLNRELPSVGRGHPRVVTTLDEVELRWPGAHLRVPRERKPAGQ